MTLRKEMDTIEGPWDHFFVLCLPHSSIESKTYLTDKHQKKIFQILWHAHCLKINFPHTQVLFPKNNSFWSAEGFLEESLLSRGEGVVERDLLILMISINLMN